MKRRSAHHEVCNTKHALHREPIQGLWGQAELLMKKFDPGNIVADTLGGGKCGGQVGDVIAYGERHGD